MVMINEDSWHNVDIVNASYDFGMLKEKTAPKVLTVQKVSINSDFRMQINKIS